MEQIINCKCAGLDTMVSTLHFSLLYDKVLVVVAVVIHCAVSFIFHISTICVCLACKGDDVTVLLVTTL